MTNISREHDIREQIIVAATEHFSLYGYQKTTVSELAKAIGFSKAYIYKFFESKQAIGEMVCAKRLTLIMSELNSQLAGLDSPSEKLCVMFKQLAKSEMALFFHERQLYDIVVSASTENWTAVHQYKQAIAQKIRNFIQEGRERGDFESVSDLDSTSQSVYVLMSSYLHPLTLQFYLDNAEQDIDQLNQLILRSLQAR